MATQKKRSFAKVMTGEGTLIYPKLNKPDQYKDNKPQYQSKIRLSAEESQKLIEKIEAEVKAYWPEAEAEMQAKVDAAKTGPEKAKAKKALAEMKEADKAYKPAYDDEGNETGEYEFNFKMPASFKSQKDGKEIPLKPDLFDAAGNLLKNPPEIWGGTVACVAGELRPFNMPIGVGVSLRLKAVQIVKLNTAGGGERDAGSYGFGAKDGYEADAEVTNGGFQDRSGGEASGSGSDDGDDF